MIRSLAIVAALAATMPQPPAAPPIRGITSAPAIARVYDRILDADFERLTPFLASRCTAAPPPTLAIDDFGNLSALAEACQVLEAVGLWWELALDPERRGLDARFSQAVERAIAATEAWTRRDPLRAESWFYHGAAYGARVQFRVLRQQRLAAARDGGRIKESLERALALDPTLEDAKFGIGMYRYYASVAPAALRFLRWLFLLPGGDRAQGLQMILDARERGQLVRSEADYQLHLIYLWYEKRSVEALAIIRTLAGRHPHNPLFPQIEAEILDVYFHDVNGATRLLKQLIARAESGRVHAPAVAIARAHASLRAIETRAKR